MNRISIFFVTFLIPAVLGAQNLDPTVEVRRTYQGKLLEVHKPSLEMSVPDSLTNFDLDFDYSVFNNPYKGAYEFSPYKMLMSPLGGRDKARKFYMRAGLGYELHPCLDLTWAAVSKDRLHLDVWATHNSFVGNYRKIDYNPSDLALTWNRQDKEFGYDLKTNAGTTLRYDWYKGRLDLNAAYYGVHQKDMFYSGRCYDALDVNFGISSKSEQEHYFMYDIRADYRFGTDKYLSLSPDRLQEHVVSFNAVLGQVFGSRGSLLFDVGADYVAMTGPLTAYAAGIHFVPHYSLSRGLWNLDIGVRLGLIFPSVASDAVGLYGTKGQYVYPDIKVSFAAIPDAMKIYAKIGGGEKMNTLASTLERNRHAGAGFSTIRRAIFDNTIERISASVGLEGRIGRRFSYDVKARYGYVENGLMDGVTLSGGKYLPILGYASYNRFQTILECALRTDPVDVELEAAYDLTRFVTEPVGLFEPSEFEGDLSFTYNWRRRIFVGADVRWATSMKGMIEVLAAGIVTESEARIPGYADLGVNFEYVFNRRFSLWARGGNLLNMTIQRSPLYAEGGINFTAGICLSF